MIKNILVMVLVWCWVGTHVMASEQHVALKQAIMKSKDNDVHLLLSHREQPVIRSVSALAVPSSSNIADEDNELLTLAQQAETAANNQSGAPSVVLHILAGIVVGGVGISDLITKYMNYKDDNMPIAQAAASGTFSAITDLGFVAASAHQFYLAGTNAHVVEKRLNAAKVTRMVQGHIQQKTSNP